MAIKINLNVHSSGKHALPPHPKRGGQRANSSQQKNHEKGELI